MHPSPMSEGRQWRSIPVPLVVALLVVGTVLGGLLVGYEPVGGDPDRIYRPIKAELARSLDQGQLPFWSDRLGMGVPLIAESHVAAFYPPNQVLYRVFDVSTAYRLSMWGHHLLLVVAVFAYGRWLGLEPWGAALASVSFAFCGFLTIHSSHEWAYQSLAYLPLCLLMAGRYAETGRWTWLAGLALAWGCQILVGHFQVQMWTAGLVVATAGWRVVADRQPLRRLVGLAVGLAWGGSVASAQLVPTWELAQLVGQTRRSFADLSFYSYPPNHWIEVALPWLFRRVQGGPESPYWFSQQTTGFEACFYVGTIPLILAFVGLIAGSRDRLTVWRLIVPASLALATMPRWWPEGYAAVLQVPGLGYFRCPARYTAVASLGLALLAGRGLDRTVSGRRFALGIGLAVLFALGAFAWACRPELRKSIEPGGLTTALAVAGTTWALGFAALLAWRAGRVGPWLPLVLTAVELGVLYHSGTTRWGWSIPLPSSSPALEALTVEKVPVGRVAGPLDNLPIRAGLATATPYAGFPLPEPHLWLKLVTRPKPEVDPIDVRCLRRFGVTHAIHDGTAAIAGELIYRGEDLALDRLAIRQAGTPEHRVWSVVRLPRPFPEARVAIHLVAATDLNALVDYLSRVDALDEACSLPEARPPLPQGPRAHSARLIRWDGTSGEVEHDGVCDLVLSRAYYPGWLARVDDGPEQPTWPADGGLLAVRIEGAGVSRVSIRFQPNGWPLSALASSIAVVAAVGVVGLGLWRARTIAPGGLQNRVGLMSDG